jgi:hypothetical protein
VIAVSPTLVAKRAGAKNAPSSEKDPTMANGASAARLIPKPPSASGPPADPRSGIEVTIGEATADAVVAIACAMTDFEAGGAMTPEVRKSGGESLGRLARLALLGEIPDWGTVARAEGRRVLLSRHGLILRQQFVDGAGLEKALDEMVGWAVTIAEKVAHDEQVLQRAWAN